MKKILFIFLFLPFCVSAYSVNFQVLNYNTLAPVQSANITLTNTTTEISTLTDVYGVGSFILFDNYTISIWKSGYATYDSTLNITNDTTRTVYLNQLSTEGIVKITVVDLSLSEHTSCIYFSNGRLKECYPLNETWELHNNLEYQWIPMISKLDLVSNPTGLKNYVFMFAGVIASLIIFVFIILFIIFSVYAVIKYAKK